VAHLDNGYTSVAITNEIRDRVKRDDINFMLLDYKLSANFYINKSKIRVN